MRIQIIAVGDRMPAWVEAGVLDYQRRLSGTLRLEWRPIAPAPARPGRCRTRGPRPGGRRR